MAPLNGTEFNHFNYYRIFSNFFVWYMYYAPLAARLPARRVSKSGAPVLRLSSLIRSDRPNRTKVEEEEEKAARKMVQKCFFRALISSSSSSTPSPSFSFFSGSQTVVNVNLFVRSFEKIDDVKMVSGQSKTFLQFPTFVAAAAAMQKHALPQLWPPVSN
jgi:hypothetical protein